MQKTEAAGGIVLNLRGEVALVVNGKDFWGFPKGHIDPGEDALTAARREIQEETGLTQLTLIREFPPYERYRGLPGGGEDHAELKTIHMYLFTTDEEALVPEDPQNPEARWVMPTDVEALLTNKKDREFFRGLDISVN